ncbi:MAG: hypothetical protein RR585_04520 [Coprobacillus sp.]
MNEIYEAIVTSLFMTLMFIGGCLICAYTASKESGKSLKEELFDEEAED